MWLPRPYEYHQEHCPFNLKPNRTFLPWESSQTSQCYTACKVQHSLFSGMSASASQRRSGQKWIEPSRFTRTQIIFQTVSLFSHLTRESCDPPLVQFCLGDEIIPNKLRWWRFGWQDGQTEQSLEVRWWQSCCFHQGFRIVCLSDEHYHFGIRNGTRLLWLVFPPRQIRFTFFLGQWSRVIL